MATVNKGVTKKVTKDAGSAAPAEKAAKTIDLVDVKVIGVSSPASIASIAKAQGLETGEVFVRLLIEHKGVEYSLSQKLRFLRKDGYQALLDAVGKTISVTVSDNGFFYLTNHVTVDDLFTKSETTASRNISTLFK